DEHRAGDGAADRRGVEVGDAGGGDVERAAREGGKPFGDELRAAVDEARLLGAVLQRLAGDLVVVRFVGLAEVRGISVRDRPLAAHPVQRGAGIEAPGERDADLLAGGKMLQNRAHAETIDSTSGTMHAVREPSSELRAQFGDVDIYLFDQLLRGRFDRRRRILDAGCGSGRHLRYFLAAGFDVYAIDEDPAAVSAARTLGAKPAAVSAARKLAASAAPKLPPDNIRQGTLHALPWADARMDAVICSAVLHFARDRSHFDRMLDEMWRVLARGGMFFARLASSIGLESRLTDTTGRVKLPERSARYVSDEQLLLDAAYERNAALLDPIKTTNVQNQRCMTTWVLQKG